MTSQPEFQRTDVNQESQYTFPYHYIPSFENGHFSQHLCWSWGYAYIGALEFVLSVLSEEPFESLVDIGCGDGRFLREVDKRFSGKRLLGTDCSKHAIDLARAMNPQLCYDCVDICEKNSPSETFDVATLIEVLEHIPLESVEAFVAATARYLEPGGTLLLTVPHSNHPVAPKHFQHFDSTSLREILEPHYALDSFVFIDKRVRVLKRLMNLLLANNIFVLNNQMLLDFLFGVYRKYFFFSDESSCERIFVKCRKE